MDPLDSGGSGSEFVTEEVQDALNLFLAQDGAPGSPDRQRGFDPPSEGILLQQQQQQQQQHLQLQPPRQPPGHPQHPRQHQAEHQQPQPQPQMQQQEQQQQQQQWQQQQQQQPYSQGMNFVPHQPPLQHQLQQPHQQQPQGLYSQHQQSPLPPSQQQQQQQMLYPAQFQRSTPSAPAIAPNFNQLEEALRRNAAAAGMSASQSAMITASSTASSSNSLSSSTTSSSSNLAADGTPFSAGQDSMDIAAGGQQRQQRGQQQQANPAFSSYLPQQHAPWMAFPGGAGYGNHMQQQQQQQQQPPQQQQGGSSGLNNVNMGFSLPMTNSSASRGAISGQQQQQQQQQQQRSRPPAAYMNMPMQHQQHQQQPLPAPGSYIMYSGGPHGAPQPPHSHSQQPQPHHQQSSQPPQRMGHVQPAQHQHQQQQRRQVAIMSAGPRPGAMGPAVLAASSSEAGAGGGTGGAASGLARGAASGAGSASNAQQDDRRQRRLARNRESARQSRRRKKQYLELLEDKVTQLSEEIDSLRLIHLENSERALRILRDTHLNELERIASTADGESHDLPAPPSSHLAEMDVAVSSSTSSLSSPLPPVSSSAASAFPVSQELSFQQASKAATAADSVLSSLAPHLSEPLPSSKALSVGGDPPAPSSSSDIVMHAEGDTVAAADAGKQAIPPAYMKARKEEALIHGLRVMSERFGSDCDERRAVSSYQFELLWSQLLPPPMRFLLWMMVQSEDFYERRNQDPAAAAAAARSLQTSVSGERIMFEANSSTARSTNTLWPLICHELNLTHEQEEKVRQVQRRLRENKEAWAEHRLLSLLSVHLERLHMGLRGCAYQTEARWNRLREVLTPDQMVAYLGWVKRNRDRLQQGHLEESVIQAAARRLDGDTRQQAKHGQEQWKEKGKLEDSFADATGDSTDKKLPASSVAPGASSNQFRCMGPSLAMANESRETVTALLRKPSEELTLDDIEFLLNCVRKVPALALQPPFATHNIDEDVFAASSQDGASEIMDDQSD